jgi:FtsH-like protein
LAVFIIFFLLQQFILRPLLARSVEISYSDFKAALRAGNIQGVTVSDTQITGTRKDATPFPPPGWGQALEDGGQFSVAT